MPGPMTPRKGQAEVILKWRFEEGQLLRAYRRAAGLTQAQLSEVAKLSDKQTVSLWETGNRHIPGEDIEAVAKALGIEVSALAKSILRYQSPFIYAHLFGADPKLKGELHLMRVRD